MAEGTRHILLVEDDEDLGATIAENLEAEGYSVSHAADGDAGLVQARAGGHDLLLLDVMLPGIDGFEICARLRDEGHAVPVLFLTARTDPEDRIRGLEQGGDDYLTKPFHLRELLLRVAAILRRSEPPEPPAESSEVRFGGHRVDLQSYQVTLRDGTQEMLSHKEVMLVQLLASRPGQVVSRDEILESVWEGSRPSRRTVDNFIVRLRKRFEADPRRPRFIRSVHGVGYRFTPDGEV